MLKELSYFRKLNGLGKESFITEQITWTIISRSSYIKEKIESSDIANGNNSIAYSHFAINHKRLDSCVTFNPSYRVPPGNVYRVSKANHD